VIAAFVVTVIAASAAAVVISQAGSNTVRVAKNVAANPVVATRLKHTPARTVTVTRTTPSTSTPAAVTQPPPASAVDAAASDAARSYWNDIGDEDYQSAYAVEGSSERQQQSVANMQQDSPVIRIVHISKSVPDGAGQALVDINFYSMDTGTVSDQGECHHWIQQELWVRADGGWQYASPTSTAKSKAPDSDC
jgi:hypothetical protein